MAEAFEAELKIDTREAVRGIRDLDSQMDKLGGTSGSAGSSINTFANLTTAGIAVVQAMTRAIGSAVTALSDLAGEFERQAGIINRFTGDISKAADRTNGLISQLDLMTASNRAARAGLNLTADQLADVVVASNEYASAMGIDAIAAVDKFTKAIATGQSGALRELGVDISKVTDLEGKQAEALIQLEERFRDVESSADTFGGRMGVLQTKLDDTKTKIFELASQNSKLEEAFDDTADAVRDLGEALGLFDDDDIVSPIERFSAVVVGLFGGVASVIRSVAEAMVDVANGDWWKAAKLLTFPGLVEASFSLGKDFIEGAVAATREALDDARSSAFGSLTEDEDAAGGGGGRTRPRGGRRPSGPSEFDQLVERTADGQVPIDLEAALAEASAPLTGTSEGPSKDARGVEGKLADIDAGIGRGTKGVEKLKGSVDGLNDSLTVGQQKAVELGAALGTAIQTTLDGQGSFIKNMGHELKAWSKKEAFKEGIEAAKAFAIAAGNVIANPPLAVTKATEGAKHTAIAVALGGAASALPGGGGGGGATRPEPGPRNGNGGGGGGTTVVNVNSPVPLEQVGRMNDRASRAASRRFG